MVHIVDLDSFVNKDMYKFFLDFINPGVSLTTEVRCEHAKELSKKRGESFFLYYVYAVLRAANRIKEMRYRIKKDGTILYYDNVGLMTPISVDGGERFIEIHIEWREDFKDFYRLAIEKIKNVDSTIDPYNYVNTVAEEDVLGNILISAVPDLFFTAFTPTIHDNRGQIYPLHAIGKMVPRDGGLILPLSINVHHGFMDGYHIGKYVNLIEDYLQHGDYK